MFWINDLTWYWVQVRYGQRDTEVRYGLCFRFIWGHVYVVVDLVIISTLTFQIEHTAWKKLTRLKKGIRIISVIIFHDRILDAYTILLLF